MKFIVKIDIFPNRQEYISSEILSNRSLSLFIYNVDVYMKFFALPPLPSFTTINLHQQCMAYSVFESS